MEEKSDTLPGLLATASKTLKQVLASIDKLEENEAQPVAHKPTDSSAIQTLLTDLEKSLAEFDPDVLQCLGALKKQLESSDFHSDLNNIETKINRYDFKGAQDQVKKFKNELENRG